MRREYWAGLVAVLIAGAITGFSFGGRYRSHSTASGIYVVDRYTGEVRYCLLGKECHVVPDTSKKDPATDFSGGAKIQW